MPYPATSRSGLRVPSTPPGNNGAVSTGRAARSGAMSDALMKFAGRCASRRHPRATRDRKRGTRPTSGSAVASRRDTTLGPSRDTTSYLLRTPGDDGEVGIRPANVRDCHHATRERRGSADASGLETAARELLQPPTTVATPRRPNGHERQLIPTTASGSKGTEPDGPASCGHEANGKCTFIRFATSDSSRTPSRISGSTGHLPQ